MVTWVDAARTSSLQCEQEVGRYPVKLQILALQLLAPNQTQHSENCHLMVWIFTTVTVTWNPVTHWQMMWSGRRMLCWSWHSKPYRKTSTAIIQTGRLPSNPSVSCAFFLRTCQAFEKCCVKCVHLFYRSLFHRGESEPLTSFFALRVSCIDPFLFGNLPERALTVRRQ